MALALIIGYTNSSSRSLRPWLFLKHHGIAFEEIGIPLYREDSHARIAAYSPSGKVPVLQSGGVTVWDSRAIMEYPADRFPETQGWLAATADRAKVRALAAEMHSAVAALRTNCGMNRQRQPAP